MTPCHGEANKSIKPLLFFIIPCFKVTEKASLLHLLGSSGVGETESGEVEVDYCPGRPRGGLLPLGTVKVAEALASWTDASGHSGDDVHSFPCPRDVLCTLVLYNQLTFCYRSTTRSETNAAVYLCLSVDVFRFLTLRRG